MIVFRGKGLRISDSEKRNWDHRVVVRFQENAWVDEDTMKFWVRHMWRPWTTLVDTSPKLLVADVHRAQKTDDVLKMFREYNTTIALVPAGCTSLVQPLDVAFNAQFKKVCIFHYSFIICLRLKNHLSVSS